MATRQTKALKTQGQSLKKLKLGQRKRTSVRQHRSKLDVKGQDPRYSYRWVLSDKDDGAKIKTKIADDWELVRADEVDEIGADNIFKSEFASGNIVRQLADSKDGQFYYLMKIPKEWYNADQAEKQDIIDEKEASMFKRNSKEGENSDDTYDAIAGIRGDKKSSRIEGISTGLR